jgi:hypothetical protein
VIRPPRVFLALFSAASLAACADGPLGGSRDVMVDLTIDRQSMHPSLTDEGWPNAECLVSLRATATNGTASWSGATFRWYVGKDRAVPSDTLRLGADEARELWPSSGIAEGAGSSTTIVLTVGLPFEVDIVFDYQAEGSTSVKHASVRAMCGPPLPAQLPDAPLVTGLTIPASSTRQPGDTVVVSYSAHGSAAGIWATQLVVYGAFDRDTSTNESSASDAQRNIGVRIPVTTQLGVPVNVVVFAIDAFGQFGSRVAATNPVVDLTPPTIALLRVISRPLSPEVPPLRGPHFLGDSLWVLANAADNHSLKAIDWTGSPGGANGFLPADGNFPSTSAKILIHPEWQDGVQLRFKARDASGLQSQEILVQSAADFRVYPSRGGTALVDTILGLGQAIDEVVDEKRNRAYLLLSDFIVESRIVAVSLTDLSTVAVIPLPGLARDMDVVPSGDSLLVTIPSRMSLAVVNLSQLASPPTLLALSLLNPSSGESPDLIGITKSGKALVTAGRFPRLTQLLEVNLATGQQRFRDEAAAPAGFQGIGTSTDHSTLVILRIDCAQLYRSSTDTFEPCRTLRQHGLPSVDLTGERFAVGRDVYDASLTFLRTVESVPTIFPVQPPSVITPDGTQLYHYAEGVGLIRTRAADGAIQDRTRATPGRLRLLPGGTRVLVLFSVIADTRMSIIDLGPPAGSFP